VRGGLKVRQIDIAVFFSARDGVVDKFPEALVQGKRQGLECRFGVAPDMIRAGVEKCAARRRNRDVKSAIPAPRMIEK
jgi:hypothetical protein